MHERCMHCSLLLATRTTILKHIKLYISEKQEQYKLATQQISSVRSTALKIVWTNNGGMTHRLLGIWYRRSLQIAAHLSLHRQSLQSGLLQASWTLVITWTFKHSTIIFKIFKISRIGFTAMKHLTWLHAVATCKQILLSGGSWLAHENLRLMSDRMSWRYEEKAHEDLSDCQNNPLNTADIIDDTKRRVSLRSGYLLGSSVIKVPGCPVRFSLHKHTIRLKHDWL